MTPSELPYLYLGVVINKVGCEHAAKDIIQNACLSVLMNAERLAGMTKDEIERYVNVVVQSRTTDYFRREKKKRSAGRYEIGDYDGATGNEILDRLELKDTMQNMLRLSDIERVNILATAAGYTHRELLGYNHNINASLARVRRGRAKLKAMMQ